MADRKAEPDQPGSSRPPTTSHGGLPMSATATLDPPTADPQSKKPRSKSRGTAETPATKQRDISGSEFFAKNRHLLGFDSPRKALLTAVKEAVDNSLDASEEAKILPKITAVNEEPQ